ncbi:5'-nucleotidase [Rhodococcus tukisamuensis]|uniref:5'-nucleotidase n=1 Tax=Rhodococcus tukisamuensis TaxID=168276 RepID=A0A1G7B6G3_9NOCA|nr:5'-nucleotidase [Rhodococcus tukisamuensis]SDE22621.1 5'-nucleotidase [Rhodococcus tukisamuensis]
MPFMLDHRLVIGVASSALFDLSESDAMFHERGEAGYASVRRSTSTTT